MSFTHLETIMKNYASFTFVISRLVKIVDMTKIAGHITLKQEWHLHYRHLNTLKRNTSSSDTIILIIDSDVGSFLQMSNPISKLMSSNVEHEIA